MYEYDSGTVLVTFSPPKLYQAKGVDAEVQAEDLFILYNSDLHIIRTNASLAL